MLNTTLNTFEVTEVFHFLRLTTDKILLLKESMKSDVITMEEFWDEYDRLRHQISGTTSLIKLAGPQTSQALEHDKKTLFEEACMKVMQQLDTMISSIRESMKGEDLTVSRANSLLDQFQALAKSPLLGQLQRRHPHYYEYIANLIAVHTRDLQQRLRELKELEQSKIASVMEQIEKLDPSSMSKADVLVKCDHYLKLLDKYAEANPEWAFIGKGRLEQIQKDILEPEKKDTLDASDFFLYDEDLEELEQEEEEDEGEGEEEVVEDEMEERDGGGEGEEEDV